LIFPLSGYGSDRWGSLWFCQVGSLVLPEAALFLFLELAGAGTLEILGHVALLGVASGTVAGIALLKFLLNL
jgi:hypothetical protein